MVLKLQMKGCRNFITNLFYDDYVGQVARRLDQGTLQINEKYSLCTEEGIKNNLKLSALYTFKVRKRICREFRVR